MILEYYAQSQPKNQAVLQCEFCGEIRRVRRVKQLLNKESHPCRSCSNKINGKRKVGKKPWNAGKRYSIKDVERTSYIDSFGYVQVWCGRGDGSRGRKDGYRLEHHLAMEDHLGRKLQRNEIVHHIDGDKRNNSIENLHLCSNVSDHRQIHNQLEELAMSLVRLGKIKFSNGEYYLDHRVIES